MFSPEAGQSVTFRRSVCALGIVAVIFALTFALAAQAQTYSVIHYFTGAGDGYYPWGLTIDQAGNLYGATLAPPNGEVFKMTKRGSAWTLLPLYNIGGLGVVLGPGGRLYGPIGGGLYGGVLSLTPAASSCGTVFCPWIGTQLHTFTGPPDDGASPGNPDLVFDQQGNIYGTTVGGGSGSCSGGCGTVYELSQNNGVWSSSILYSFPGYSPQEFSPFGGVVFDQAGNLYGTAQGGPLNAGTVYKLTPNNGSWSKSTIYAFDYGGTSGAEPYGSLLIDASGNLYGTTSAAGQGQNGTVFELTPSNGGWNFNLLYSFSGRNIGAGPMAPLTQDAAGNLYGTTYGAGAFGYGNVFKLTHTNGSWTYTSLHDFDGSDGRWPESKVVIDAQGNLYGTTTFGGLQNPACSVGGECGVVWEITP